MKLEIQTNVALQKLRLSSLAFAGLLSANANAEAAMFEILQGQRKPVAAVVSPTPRGARQICLDFNDAVTGAPAEVHLWRNAEPGGTKDLARAVGRRCLDSKGFRYVITVMAVNTNVIVRVPDQFALNNLPSARSKEGQQP